MTPDQRKFAGRVEVVLRRWGVKCEATTSGGQLRIKATCEGAAAVHVVPAEDIDNGVFGLGGERLADWFADQLRMRRALLAFGQGQEPSIQTRVRETAVGLPPAVVARDKVFLLDKKSVAFAEVRYIEARVHRVET